MRILLVVVHDLDVLRVSVLPCKRAKYAPELSEARFSGNA